MSGNDYVKFMTEEIVRYMNLPQEEKKKRKEEKKQSKESRSNHWFGVIPFAVKLLIKQRKRK